MFKCWMYISGENEISLNKEERLSDKKEVYKSSDVTVKENESKIISSFIPEMRKFNFFDRSVNFS